MDLLSGYGSDASSGSDEDAPSINPSVASEKPGPEKPTVAQDGKPNVRKVSLKGLSALLPPPRTAITSGNGTGDSDEEGEEPLWKRLKSSKPTGASLASLLPKPVHDAPAPSRGTINLTDTTPSAPPVAVRPPQVPKPKPAVESAPVREPAPAAAPPSRFKVDFGLSDAAPAPKPAQPSWAPPRVVAIAPVAPSAAASYDPCDAYAVGRPSASGVSYEDAAGPIAPSAAGPSSSLPSEMPAGGLDKHMRRALAGGAVPVMESFSISDISTKWNPSAPDADVGKKEKVEVQSKFWSAAAGEVVTSNKPNRMQSKKHQINSLAFQAKQMEADLLNRKAAGSKTKAQTYGRYGW